MELVLNPRNLDEFKEKLRNKYPQLTEVDLQHEEGKEEGMLRMIEYKLHKTKQEMLDLIAKL